MDKSAIVAGLDRRALLLAMVATPLAARLPQPDADFTASPIRWPLPDTRTAHGYMAVPARARGPQPAILLLGDPSADELDDRVLVRALAQAGFVAVTLNRSAPAEAPTIAATLHWLAANRYATGKVALLGIGSGALAAGRALAAHDVMVGAAIDPVAMALWTEAAGIHTPVPGPLDWTHAWAMVTAFFREHLA